MSNEIKLAPSWRVFLNPKNQYEREHLRWVTVLHGAIRITEAEAADRDRVAEIRSEVVGMVDGFKTGWLGMVRGRALPRGAIWRGAHELELWRLIQPGDHCYSFAEAAGCDVASIQPSDRIVIPHVHFVVAAKDIETGALKAALSRWGKPWQVLIKPLWVKEKQTYEEAVLKLSEYCNKKVLRYKTGGFDDKKVVYTDDYEITWSKVINGLYQDWTREFRNSD